MSYLSADKKILLANHSKGQDMEKVKPTAVLTGVTGLTGHPDRSDRSEPENCSIQKKQERSRLQKVLSQCIYLRSISWGHVLQAVRKSSTISLIYPFMCFVTKLSK